MRIVQQAEQSVHIQMNKLLPQRTKTMKHVIRNLLTN